MRRSFVRASRSGRSGRSLDCRVLMYNRRRSEPKEGSTAPMLDSLIRYLQQFLWSPQFANLPPVPAFGIAFLRYTYAVVRDLMSGQLTMRAMSLVYTTLLSIVPLL